MNVLVAVATKHGSTYEIAEEIVQELKAEGYAVELRSADDIADVTGYDAVILGSAVYAGNWLPEAKQFIERNHRKLAELPVWVFSSGPLGSHNPQPHDDPARLAAPLGEVLVRDHKVFVGKLNVTDLGLAERLIVLAVRAPEGDFRDWDEIRMWAQKIARELQSVPAL
ncbi:MAG: flavodoxin domain-containing protein [Anaerolineae bacterium]